MFKKSLLLFLLFLAFSCQNEAKKQSKEAQPKKLDFDTEKVIKKSGEGCLEDSFACTKIELKIPVADGPKKISENINTKLQHKIIGLFNFPDDSITVSSMEELAQSFITNYQKNRVKFNEEIPWNAYVNGRIFHQSEQLISVEIESEIFTGGAHGYASKTYLNFDPETGKLYSKRALFADGFKNYAEEKFREKQQIPISDNINSTGFWFENDVFELPQNIGISQDSVILVYNPYEIASFSDGEFVISLPREEVQQYLKFEK